MKRIRRAMVLLLVLICLLGISVRAEKAETVIELSGSKKVTITDPSVAYRITGSGGSVSLEPSKSMEMDITLDNVTITGSLLLADGASVNLYLVGENTITAGNNQAAVSKKTTAGKLTIYGPGSLTATGGANSAGIGVSGSSMSKKDTYSVITGNIVINGGTIIAQGGQYGAGIGGGRESGLDGLTINGGMVKATGGYQAAGIGGGGSHITDKISGQTYPNIDCSDVTVNGGVIEVLGGGYAPGIGGGSSIGVIASADKYSSYSGSASGIYLNGGSGFIEGNYYCAGIGGGSAVTGQGGCCYYVTISGGTWDIHGGDDAAAIGHGHLRGNGPGNYSSFGITSNVIFTGGNIRLVSEDYFEIGGQSSLPDHGMSSCSVGTRYVFSLAEDEKIISWISSKKYNTDGISPLNGSYFFWLSADTTFLTQDSEGKIRCYSTDGTRGELTQMETVSSVLDVTQMGELMLLENGFIDLSDPKSFYPIETPGYYTLTLGTKTSDADKIRTFGDLTINLSDFKLNSYLTLGEGNTELQVTGTSYVQNLDVQGEAVLSGGGNMELSYLSGNDLTVTGGSLVCQSLSGANLVGPEGQTLYRHTFSFGSDYAGERVTFTGLPSYFFAYGITADKKGNVVLWLPSDQSVSASAADASAESKVEIIKYGQAYELGGEATGTITLRNEDTVRIYRDCYCINDIMYLYTGPLTLQQSSAKQVDANISVYDEGVYDITFQELNLKSSDTIFDAENENAEVLIRLSGENTLYSTAGAAIYKGSSGTLTITGPGSLNATGGYKSSWNYGYAAIGSGGGTVAHILIKDCTITATGGDYSAGIGTGYYRSTSAGGVYDIVIDNAVVEASGGYNAAAIGTGYTTNAISSADSLGSIHDIVIRNSTVTAVGGPDAAAIGSGSSYRYVPEISDISITGSTVSAKTYGGNVSGIGFGTGKYVGDGYLENLVITDSYVQAFGIGGSGNGSVSMTVTNSTVNSELKASSGNSVVMDGGSFMAYKDCPVKNPQGQTLYRFRLRFDKAESKVTPISGWPEGYGTDNLYTDGNGDLWLWLPQTEISNLVADAGGETLTFTGRNSYNIIEGVMAMSGEATLRLEGSYLMLDVSGITPALTEYEIVWECAGSPEGPFYGMAEGFYSEEYEFNVNYELSEFDAGQYIRAVVTGEGMYAQSFTTNAIGPIAATTPVTGEIGIQGLVAAGETVSVDLSGLTPAEGTLDMTVQWFISDVENANYNNSDYLGEALNVTLDQEGTTGRYLYCRVWAKYPYSGYFRSEDIQIDKEALHGTMKLVMENGVVTVDRITTDPAGTSVTYSWERVKDGVVTKLNGTTNYYRLQTADAGCIIRCLAKNGQFSGAITAEIRIPDPSLGNIVVENVSLAEDILHYDMTNNSTMEQAQLIIAAYDAPGKLIDLDVRSVALVTGSCTEDLSRFAEEMDVRVFWVQKETSAPLCQQVRCRDLITTP